MNLARRRPSTDGFSTEALCTRILERHRASIRVLKPRLAVPNLARIIGAPLTLSSKQGSHAPTLRQLAEASGFSIGGVYAYVDSKPRPLSTILGEVAPTVTVNRAKYRKGGTSIEGHIDGVGGFVSAALSSSSRIYGRTPAGIRTKPKPMAHS